MITEPNFYEDLIAAVAEHQMQILDRLLSLPIDGVLLGVCRRTP